MHTAAMIEQIAVMSLRLKPRIPLLKLYVSAERS
jgi:hypothetical protein